RRLTPPLSRARSRASRHSSAAPASSFKSGGETFPRPQDGPVSIRRTPAKTGLYDPAYEHDACGVAFVARLDATPSHETVRRALTALENLEHRGASGADADSGDGAGILLQIPDGLFRSE